MPVIQMQHVIILLVAMSACVLLGSREMDLYAQVCLFTP